MLATEESAPFAALSSRMPQGPSEAYPQATDQYFQGDPHLVATFDFDYDTIIDFKTKTSWAGWLLVPPCWLTTVCCVPCFINQNVQWEARARHVAITIDGIRFVKERHPTLCGLSCTDKGKEAKTVPFDKITDCDVQEPAGMACCCCIPNVLSKVHVDTASSGATAEGVKHELNLEGLRYPNEFKAAVWSMKRGQAPAGATMPMGVGAAPSQQQMENNQLLQDIREELRTLTGLLRQQAVQRGS